jgi:hypothetical protein
MDDALKSKLLSYLNEMEAAATTGKDFLIEQAPLYVQELVYWEFCDALSSACLCLLFLVLFWAAFTVTFFVVRKMDFELRWGIRAGAFAATLVFSLFPTIPPIGARGGLFGHVSRAVQCKVAPRVVIVEKLREAMN